MPVITRSMARKRLLGEDEEHQNENVRPAKRQRASKKTSIDENPAKTTKTTTRRNVRAPKPTRSKRKTERSEPQELPEVPRPTIEPELSQSSHKNEQLPPQNGEKGLPVPLEPGTGPSVDEPQTLKIIECDGSLFEAPRDALLVHSCNCRGSWGGGIAALFAKLYPKAFKAYQEHCKAQDRPSKLVGTALMIPPLDSTEIITKGSPAATKRLIGASVGNSSPGSQRQAAGSPRSVAGPATLRERRQLPRRHFIGCLFTSDGFGKTKGSEGSILAATAPAMRDLLTQMRAWNEVCDKEAAAVNLKSTSIPPEGLRSRIGQVWMCRINSGLFRVPWTRSRAELAKLDVRDLGAEQVTVLSPTAGITNSQPWTEQTIR